MKKKNLIWMLTFMMVATMCVCFTSCSKDSDDDNGGIIGNWMGKDSRDQITLSFKTGGSGTWQFIRYKKKTTPLVIEEERTGSFSYVSKDDTKGTITVPGYFEPESEQYVSYDYVITGNMMYLYDSKHPDDLEWTLTKQ